MCQIICVWLVRFVYVKVCISEGVINIGLLQSGCALLQTEFCNINNKQIFKQSRVLGIVAWDVPFWNYLKLWKLSANRCADFWWCYLMWIVNFGFNWIVSLWYGKC